MNRLKALEMAHCAEINLQNMVKMMPILKQHPLLFIVEDQIKECIKELELDEDQSREKREG